MTKGWTEERRRAQAERIKKCKPWEKSTGPKTPAGKRAASMNAFKHGAYSAWARAVKRALYHNREFVKEMQGFAALEALRNELLKKR